MVVSMYMWLDRRFDKWQINGWIDGLIDGWICGQIDGWIDILIERKENKQILESTEF